MRRPGSNDNLFSAFLKIFVIHVIEHMLQIYPNALQRHDKFLRTLAPLLTKLSPATTIRS